MKYLFSLLILLLLSCNNSSFPKPEENTISPAGNYRGEITEKATIKDKVIEPKQITVIFSIGTDNSLQCDEIFDKDGIVKGNFVKKVGANSYSATYEHLNKKYEIKFNVLNESSIYIDITSELPQQFGGPATHNYTGTLSKN